MRSEFVIRILCQNQNDYCSVAQNITQKYCLSFINILFYLHSEFLIPLLTTWNSHPQHETMLRDRYCIWSLFFGARVDIQTPKVDVTVKLYGY